MDNILKIFIAESVEKLRSLDHDLLELEKNPTNISLINDIFRVFHGIKGTCGFLNLPRLEKISHHVENVLDQMRQGTFEVTSEEISIFFKIIDYIQTLLLDIETLKKEPEGEDFLVFEMLDSLLHISSLHSQEFHIAENHLLSSESSSSRKIIHMDVALIEKLMSITSELVLLRNKFLQFSQEIKNISFSSSIQSLSHLTSELQENVMKSRLQPIGNIWNFFPRLVRDLSLELHKKIKLEMHGSSTELDLQILELIKDPLTHLIRNAVDHGIEDAKDRIFAGKPEVGKIMLTAYHEGGYVFIEVQDDGRGIDSEHIRTKALQLGIISKEEAKNFSASKIEHLIFYPGFSTASEITTISGRGVGLDIVKSYVERAGGSIDLINHHGIGSKFVLCLPLTLAIISVIIVNVSGERFSIPQLKITELVRINNEIEYLENTPVLRLRDQLVPLIFLSQALGLENDNYTAQKIALITKKGSKTFGIIVDSVCDAEEIVIKPIDPMLQHLSIFSGLTILGDGTISVIIDPTELLRTFFGDVINEPFEQTPPLPPACTHLNYVSILFFQTRDGMIKAVPLSFVSRIEKIDFSKVRYSLGFPMIQHRDTLIPLITIGDSSIIPSAGEHPVIILENKTNFIGLIVKDILDITDEPLSTRMHLKNEKIVGHVTFQEEIIEVVNPSYLINKVYAEVKGK